MARRHQPLDLRAVEPPRDELVRRRYLSASIVQAVREQDRILVEHGQVCGVYVFPKRHQARWQARRLIDLLTDLRLHERWELVEHVDRVDGGFKWTVEYVGRRRA